MSDIPATMFSEAYLSVFDETFQKHYGIFLDKDTTLFQTLASISAAEASQPVSPRCASLAAQVEHTNFYLEVMEQVLHGRDPGHQDWDDIWRRVQAVTDAEWQASQARLKETATRIRSYIQSIDTWQNAHQIGAAIAIIAHSAYHLGEIRQALCTLRPA